MAFCFGVSVLPPLLHMLSSDVFPQPINRSYVFLHPFTHRHQLMHTCKTGRDTHTDAIKTASELFVTNSFPAFHLFSATTLQAQSQSHFFFPPGPLCTSASPHKSSGPVSPFFISVSLSHLLLLHLPAPLLSFSTPLLFPSSVSQPAVWQRCRALMEAARVSAHIYSPTYTHAFT